MAKNLKQASKAAQHRAKVASLDNLGTEEKEFDLKDTMSAIEGIMGDFIERVHENINKEKDFVTTGAINNIELESRDNQIIITAPPHLIYQDRGVNGRKLKLYDTPHSYKDKRPPVAAFKEWIKKKGTFLTEKNQYHKRFDTRLTEQEKANQPFKELTDDELIDKAAWAISTKIYNTGFKPRKIYSKEIPKLIDDLDNLLGDFVVQQINQAININPRAGGGNRTIIVK